MFTGYHEWISCRITLFGAALSIIVSCSRQEDKRVINNVPIELYPDMPFYRLEYEDVRTEILEVPHVSCDRDRIERTRGGIRIIGEYASISYTDYPPERFRIPVPRDYDFHGTTYYDIVFYLGEEKPNNICFLIPLVTRLKHGTFDFDLDDEGKLHLAVASIKRPAGKEQTAVLEYRLGNPKTEKWEKSIKIYETQGEISDADVGIVYQPEEIIIVTLLDIYKNTPYHGVGLISIRKDGKKRMWKLPCEEARVSIIPCDPKGALVIWEMKPNVRWKYQAVRECMGLYYGDGKFSNLSIIPVECRLWGSIITRDSTGLVTINMSYGEKTHVSKFRPLVVQR